MSASFSSCDPTFGAVQVLTPEEAPTGDLGEQCRSKVMAAMRNTAMSVLRFSGYTAITATASKPKLALFQLQK